MGSSKNRCVVRHVVCCRKARKPPWRLWWWLSNIFSTTDIFSATDNVICSTTVILAACAILLGSSAAPRDAAACAILLGSSAAPRDAAACDAAACDAAACEDAAARDAAACDDAAARDAAGSYDAAPNDECTIDDCYASAGYVLASGAFSALRHQACGTCKAGSSRGQAYSIQEASRQEEASEERLLPLSVDEDVERTPQEAFPITCTRHLRGVPKVRTREQGQCSTFDVCY